MSPHNKQDTGNREDSSIDPDLCLGDFKDLPNALNFYNI